MVSPPESFTLCTLCVWPCSLRTISKCRMHSLPCVQSKTIPPSSYSGLILLPFTLYSGLQKRTCSFKPLQNLESWFWFLHKWGTCSLCHWHLGVEKYEFNNTIHPKSNPVWPGNSSHPHTESYSSFCNSESWHNFSGFQTGEEVWPPPSQRVYSFPAQDKPLPFMSACILGKTPPPPPGCHLVLWAQPHNHPALRY
jgi:hypothetical protein